MTGPNAQPVLANCLTPGIVSNLRVIGGPSILTFGLLTPQGNTFITGTAFEFTIDYGGPAALVFDTVPAEFVVTDVSATNGAAISFSIGKGNPSKGATRIQWEPPDGWNTLTVTIETRESPGKGHKGKVFKPTSCGPLPLNDGATAYLDADGNQLPDVDADGNPIIILGPSNSLEVEAVQGVKPCDSDTLTADATVATDCDDGGEITLNWTDDNDDIEVLQYLPKRHRRRALQSCSAHRYGGR